MSLGYFKKIAENLLSTSVQNIGLIVGGRNSQVYKVICNDDVQYVLKVYFKHESDKRDRLGTEYTSMRFLWDHGVRNIPKAIIAAPEYGCAIYAYVDGQKIQNGDITDQDIDQAVTFLNILKNLTECTAGWSFNAASEACFSFRAIWENIHSRLNALISCYEGDLYDSPLRDFIEQEFNPAKETIDVQCRLKLKDANLSFDMELDATELTLSPSDFGFHNALRVVNGDLVFLDFEYFGWDDPAKMVVDMLLHPGMKLSMLQKQRFFRGILEHFHKCPNLPERIEIVYPLFGLKWCLILLNEFLPERLLLRNFAGMNTRDHQALQAIQLNKARSLLHKILHDYESFPYAN